MKILYVICLIGILFCSQASSTEQRPDRLISNGKVLYFVPDVMSTTNDSVFPRFDEAGTACWRGYIATWELIDSALFLVGIEGKIGGKPVGLRDILSNVGEKVFAKWFTGQIVIEDCDGVGWRATSVLYDPMVRIGVQNGIVANYRTIANRDLCELVKQRRKRSFLAPFGLQVGVIAFILLIVGVVHATD